MNPLVAALPALCVSSIFCIWSVYVRTRLRQARLQRERVAWMLWVAASRIEGGLPEPIE